MPAAQASKNKQFARRLPNSSYRSREHLLPRRWKSFLRQQMARDATMILLLIARSKADQ
jgi:hypothetical protein